MNEDRYYVVYYSPSRHCCFEAAVIDRERVGKYDPEAVCECFEPADAEIIASELNEREEMR